MPWHLGFVPGSVLPHFRTDVDFPRVFSCSLSCLVMSAFYKNDGTRTTPTQANVPILENIETPATFYLRTNTRPYCQRNIQAQDKNAHLRRSWCHS